MDDLFVYDDDCGFCTWWAEFFEEHSDMRIVGFSELDPSVRDRLPDEYESCSHLVTDDAVYSCGASLEEALLRSNLGSYARPVVTPVRDAKPYRAVWEQGYRWVAGNRSFWGKLLSKPTEVREKVRDDDA